MPLNRSITVGYPPPPTFVEFLPNTGIWPNGKYDDGTTNVGCRIPEPELEIYNGDISLTGGSTIEGVKVNGRITGQSATAVVRDVILQGGDNSNSNAQSWLARGSGTNGSFAGALFEWVTLDQTGREGGWTNGFEGGDYTARYCDIVRTVDGAEFNGGSNVTHYCNRISRGVYFAWWNTAGGALRTTTFTDYGGRVRTAPFPSQSSGDVHADGIQIMRGQNNLITGCNIGGPRSYTSAQTTHLDPTVAADYAIMAAMDADEGFGTSALMINGDTASPLGLTVEYNLLGGGTATVNLGPSGADTLSGVIVRNNTFRRPKSGVSTYAILDNASAATITGNVWEDTGTAVPIS